jgi:cell division protein FtsQ
MKKEGKKAGRRHAVIGYILVAAWIFSMALAGFFMPVLMDTLPYFRVKAIQVEGNRVIPAYVFSKAALELKNNWLFITEGRLLALLNVLTGNSVEEVKIDRTFQKDGVVLKVRVKERVPFLTVIEGEKAIFFDEKGVPFFNKYFTPQKPYVYAPSMDPVKENFSTVKKLMDVCKRHLSHVDSIYISELNTLIYMSNGSKILLPVLQQIGDATLRRLDSIYNISMEAKEINLTTEGMAIIKGGE